MSDVICITNRKLCREDFLVRVEKIAKCHPKAIILREKDLSEDEYKELAEQVMKICAKYDTTCILHYFTDVALELHAIGIHLPMQKLLETDQKVLQNFEFIGVSCHSLEDVLIAQKQGCTYVTLGHIFDTDCKKGLPGRGIDFLQNICREVSIPIYAIGGIDLDLINIVIQSGASGACLMSAFMTCKEELLGILCDRKDKM